MDVTNEQAKLDALPPSDHVIPQMVVTLPEDEVPSSNGHSNDDQDAEFEDISVAVRDIVTKCADTVSHSVRQRPLLIEKNVQDLDKDEGGAKCPPSNVTPPPPPPPIVAPPPPAPSPVPSAAHPTAMQRPLVFDGGASSPSEDSPVFEMSLNEPPTVDNELTVQQECHPAETEPERSPDECSTPTKKEGLQGVKKFFDNLLHHETPEADKPQNRWSFEIADGSSEKSKKSQSESPTPLVESPSSKESSFAKEAKQSIKSFFDTFKHESEPSGDSRESVKLDISSSVGEASSAKSRPLTTPPEFIAKDPKQQDPPKHSTSFAKDTKKNIKTFFDHLKQDPCEEQKLKKDEDKKSVSQPNIAQAGLPENSTKEPTSFAKDTKQNIKAFFDTFKHEEPKQPKSSSSQKSEETEDSPNLPSTSPPKTSFAKDTKQNIKAFFETFKHDEQKQPKEESAMRTSASQPIIVVCSEQEGGEANLQPESPKESSSSFVKDTKHNIKTFFDSLKHEQHADKQKDACKKSPSQPDFTRVDDNGSPLPAESAKVSKDKEGKKKSFFDSFKPETSSSSKSENIPAKKSTADASKEEVAQPHESTSFAKGKSSGSPLPAESAKVSKDKEGKKKSFFDSFKPETSSSKSENIPAKKSTADASKEEVAQPNESTSFSKGKSSGSPLPAESAKVPKDKEGKKKSFFDSFKTETSSSSKSENIPAKSTVDASKEEAAQPHESTSFAKDAKQNIKTFFDSFKHEAVVESSKSKGILTNKEISSDTQPDVVQHKEASNPIKKLFSTKHSVDGTDAKAAKSSKDKQPKIPKSVTLDLNPQYSPNGDGSGAELDNSFSINEQDKEPVGGTLTQPEKKKLNLISSLKKTEVVVSSVSLDSPPEGKSGEPKGFKKFLDSFKHSKSQEGQVEDRSKDIHAMDLAVAPKSSEKLAKEKKGKSIKRSLSDRVNREEVVQNFKGFFDSIGHKSTKKADAEHIYDVVEIRSDRESGVPRAAPQAVTDGRRESGKSNAKSEGVKKILSPFRSKDTSKQGLENTGAVQGKEGASQAAELPKSAETPPTAVKENVVSPQGMTDSESPKQHEKSSVFDAIGENILALKEKVMHTKEKRKSGLIEESSAGRQSPKVVVEEPKPPMSAVCETAAASPKTQPVIADTPSTNETPPPTESRVQIMEDRPASLYNTCCIKLAVLLRDKAMDIAATRPKSPPPPKPPKPSAEAIAKARAAAVSKRLAHQKMRSVGETIDVRYADDETESSCDYKDVENFDYIMDYELVNRYRLDSSKFDTFSTDTGMSSYYTADTLTDIYSDALMETVSLGSDISYSPKHLPSSSSSRSEPRISQGNSNRKVISKPLSSKSPKKVPPPIPPKPAVLQNISRIKEKPEDRAVASPCVNGLSLSPRLRGKFSRDPVQKRPLRVADIRGTPFSSLQHPKKAVPPKPRRHFGTVLKNESLKSVPCVTPPPPASAADSVGASEQSGGTKIEKRTLSPPRPPPPVIAKKPDRPPPPAAETLSRRLSAKRENSEKVESTEGEATEAEGWTLAEATEGKSEPSEESGEAKSAQDVTRKTTEDATEKRSSEADKDALNNNSSSSSIDAKRAIDDSLNNNVFGEEEVPKRPPRRIRSRTVEIAPVVERTEEGRKRSSSLSDIDVQKRVTFLAAEKTQDAKSLYTQINKRSGGKISQSSPDLVSSRPLPAPPPPPRRFRSLERKGKSTGDTVATRKEVEPPEENIRPPSRRRKTDKQRFFSLHSEKRKEIDDYLKRSMSVPLKPSRKAKVAAEQRYDVNANISSVEGNPNIPKSSDSSAKDSPRKRSLSNWYDECDVLNESWEVVEDDTVDSYPRLSNPLVPLRRKSDGKRKSRETSKFYVNVDEESSDKGTSPLPVVAESPLPPVHQGSSVTSLVDKETSPLPLDCSEKSVQTSLETLSRRSLSGDRDTEDTDELLDLAQTLQKELSTIIHRHHKSSVTDEDTPSPPSERRTHKKASSVRSSTSEVWPVTSSEESDVEEEEEVSNEEAVLRRKQKKIFYVAKEIMTSEEAFVDALKLLNVDFKAAVESASRQQRGIQIIPEEVLGQILNHLPQLQHLNENLLSELKDRIENWEKMPKIADIIVKMGPFLKLYSWYIHDFESNVSLLEESKKKYPAFAQVVKEFEASDRCRRLALHHFMLKPIQRIPQYRLLLQEYLHHMTPDHPDHPDTAHALQIVSQVANHANESMKQGDNAQKLISIQNSIMGHKEIVKPGRVFVKEGELMKLSRKGMQPRWFVLFNDLLLYLTGVQQGVYRVNHELPLTGMKVAIPIQQDYQNEFSIISVTRSFTLAARSPEERQEWIVALTKAIEENASKRSTFTHSRLNQKAQEGRGTSSEEEGGFLLGRKAPVWIPDARVTMCQLCTSEFTVTFRRHHCRACGKVVCSICSSHRISLPYLGNRIARVCDECHVRLGQGSSSACTESGETDSDNQQIAIKPHLRTDNRHLKKNKRSLPSVLKEVCANDQGSVLSGYLHKRMGKSWKRDWFVIKDKVLYEYRASEDVAALRSTPLLGYQIEPFSEGVEGVDASLLFQLSHPGQAPCVFYADTVGSAERWVSALKTATVLE